MDEGKGKRAWGGVIPETGGSSDAERNQLEAALRSQFILVILMATSLGWD